MENILELTEKEIIRENAEYVLGMYDMYGKDQEIVDMLKMKGLNDSIVQSILIEVRKPAYVKRVKQAKVMIAIGSVLLFVFVLLPYLYVSSSPDKGAGLLIVMALFLLRIGFYVVLFAISQLAIGVYLLFKYKKLLRTV